jgi:chaperone required for assembly of F1-ATPase
MLVHEFERQVDHLKPALMPFLSLCRTAVDVDLTLPTDSMLFCADESSMYRERYDSHTLPLLEKFNRHFGMQVAPSFDIQPPQVSAPSEKFHRTIIESNNWKLIGLETMTIWLKSTIGATLIA